MTYRLLILLVFFVEGLWGWHSAVAMEVACAQVFDTEESRSVIIERVSDKVRIRWKSKSDSVLVWGPNAPTGSNSKRGSIETTGGTYFLVGVGGKREIEVGLISCFPVMFGEPGLDEHLPEIFVLADPEVFFAEAYEFPVAAKPQEIDRVAGSVGRALGKLGAPTARPFHGKQGYPLLYYTTNWVEPADNVCPHNRPSSEGLEQRLLFFINVKEPPPKSVAGSSVQVQVVPLVIVRFSAEAGNWKKENSSKATQAAFDCIRERILAELKVP